MARTRFLWTVVVVGAIGIAVSAAGSWIPSLWGDEAASLMSAERPLPSLFRMLGAVDAVHGSYYLGLHAWISLFGTSPFSLRLPSAVAIGATVVAVMLIVERLGSRRLAVAAGIVCCIIPRVTYMGEEARSYAFSAAIAAWLVYLLIEIIARPNPARRWWIGYAALLALGTYVFLYTALFIVVHGVILLSVRASRNDFGRWMKAAAVGVLAAAPVLIWAILERGQIAYLASRDEVSFTTLTVGLWFGEPLFAVVAWMLIAVAVAATAWAWRSGRGAASSGEQRLPSLTVVALCWLLIPSAILIGIHGVIPVFTARYLSYCAPAAAILIASALAWLARGRRWVLVLGVALVVAAAIPSYLSQRTPYAKNNSDWAVTSAIIGAHAQPGDAIAFDEGVRPSRRPRLALHTYPQGFVNVRDVTLKLPFTENIGWSDTAYSVSAAARLGRLDGVHRVWLIEYATPTHVDSYDVAALRALGFVESARFSAHRSVVYEFVVGTPG